MRRRVTDAEVSILYESVTHKEYLAGIRTCERCGTKGKRLFRYTKTEVFCADCVVEAIKARERGVQYSIKREGDKK